MHYINISELMPPDWPFLAPFCEDPRLSWETRSGQPVNLVERLVRRPQLGRYRAPLAAVLAARARPDAVLVSHLPGPARRVNRWRMRLAPGRPHIAFAFNFTDLPHGALRRAYRRDLPGIDEFVVFSRFEQGLYAAELDLPAERFHFLPWAMEAPEVDRATTPAFEGPYLSALGGEGRDYATLFAACRALPDCRVAVIARPHSVAGLEVPANVRLFSNLPGPMAWGIVAASQGLLIPLRNHETPNGHVTIVGAQRLGVPMAVTDSAGIADYVGPDTALLALAGQADPWMAAMRDLLEDRAGALARADAARALAARQSDTGNWVRYFTGVEDRLARDGRLWS